MGELRGSGPHTGEARESGEPSNGLSENGVRDVNEEARVPPVEERVLGALMRYQHGGGFVLLFGRCAVASDVDVV